MRCHTCILNKCDKIRSGYLTLPSRGPNRGRNCYVTPAFSGVPYKGDKIRSGGCTTTFSRGRKEGGITT